MTSMKTTHPAFFHPTYGSKPLEKLDPESFSKAQKLRAKIIRADWGERGVKAIIEHLEQKVATFKTRAITPPLDEHTAGQAFALEQLLIELHNIYLTAEV